MMAGEVAEERGVEIGMEGIETKKTSSCRVIRTGTLLGFSNNPHLSLCLFLSKFKHNGKCNNVTETAGRIMDWKEVGLNARSLLVG